jgi:membrane-associated protease RseP (regulator of RpoE activity)
MERRAMHSGYRALVRGAAALGLLIGAGARLAGAQAAGGERGNGARIGRDSVFFRQRLPAGVRIDSVMVLVHALQEEAFGSSGWLSLRAKLDSLLPALPRMNMIAGEALRHPVKGWIGITVGGVPRHEMIDESGDVVRYLTHPPIISVDPDSPAQRAGIAPGDMLVAYNGVDVVDHDVNLTHLFVPERRLLVTVQRDGESKDYSVQIAKVPEQVLRRNLELSDPPSRLAKIPFGRLDERDLGGARRLEFPKSMFVPRDEVGAAAVMAVPSGFFILAPDGLFGARISTVSAGLARALKLEMGVLVNDVSEATPAAKAGLRAGDVIVAAAGQPVVTVDRLRRVLAGRLREQSIELDVARDKKTRRVTVTW